MAPPGQDGTVSAGPAAPHAARGDEGRRAAAEGHRPSKRSDPKPDLHRPVRRGSPLLQRRGKMG